jgi:hypothetical protein
MRNSLGLTLAISAALVACSSSTPSLYGNSSPLAPGGTSTGPGTSGGAASALPPDGTATDDAGSQSEAGILTAGVWDDNLNFSFFTTYLASHTGIPGDPGFLSSDYAAANDASAQRSAHSVVDVALVLDTTGSMGDEIAYLTAEFASISGAISATYPGASQRWALVVYRDTPDTDPGDDYVVKSYDFTPDMNAFASTVGAQTAANGGDYPESPELGIQQLAQLTWRTDPSVAKLAFWVADAPQHDYRGTQMKQAIVQTQQAGIHMYPVSASGTDDLLELTMRSAAQLTGGRYLFLTDDSGVGDPHKIPEIPCYFVTRLERALVRVVGMELSGTYAGPNPADVIRVSGTPSASGTCALAADAGTVQIF